MVDVNAYAGVACWAVYTVGFALFIEAMDRARRLDDFWSKDLLINDSHINITSPVMVYPLSSRE